METAFDVLRTVNVVLAGGCCALLITSLMNRWEQLNRRTRHLAMWFSLFLAWAAYVMVESLAVDLEPLVRVPLLTVLLLGVLHRLVWKFDQSD
jgi:hypothetical protein